MSQSPPTDDPPPIPPIAPGMQECCRGGCDPCIFDLYQDELRRYEAALRRWQERRRPKRPLKLAPSHRL